MKEEKNQNDKYWEEEYKRCQEDPVYFYENYFLINGEKPVVTDKDRYFLNKFCKGEDLFKSEVIIRFRKSVKEMEKFDESQLAKFLFKHPVSLKKPEKYIWNLQGKSLDNK